MAKVNQTSFINAKIVKQLIAVAAISWERSEISFRVFLFMNVRYICGMKLKKPIAVPTLRRNSTSTALHHFNGDEKILNFFKYSFIRILHAHGYFISIIFPESRFSYQS